MENLKLDIENIRKRILLNVINSQREVNEIEEKNIIDDLKELLDVIKEMQYNNCSVELFEELVDEELIIDLLTKNNKLDKETVKEIYDNKEAYLNGSHTCSKLIDDILGGL